MSFVFVALCLASSITTANEVLIHYRWNNPQSLVGRNPGGPIESLRALEFSIEQLRQRDVVPECLGKATIRNVLTRLRLANTESDFVAGLQYLRERNLWEKLDIREREPEYYYSSHHHELVKHLLHDEPGDVLAFFMYDLWQDLQVVSAYRRKANEELRSTRNELKSARSELKSTQKELKRTAKRMQDLENSRSYRLGRILLYLPRKIRDLLRRTAHRTDA